MQGGIDGGQSGPVFRKLSQRWWWQWDLSHRPCCALCSSQTLGNPTFGSTLIVGAWVLCSGCSSGYYLSGSYDQDILCFWCVGELHPANLTDRSCPPTTLSLWPVGFPVVHVLLDTVLTTWNFFSNWKIDVYLWGQGEMSCLLKPSLIFVCRKLFPFSHFLKLKLAVSCSQHKGKQCGQ